MDLSHLDDRTALLVVTLQLEDLRQLQTPTGKGKQCAVDDKSDDHHAQELLEEDLETLKASLELRIQETVTQQTNADGGRQDEIVPQHHGRIVTTGLLLTVWPQGPDEVTDHNTSTTAKGIKSLSIADEGYPAQPPLQTDDDETASTQAELLRQPESSTWAASRKTKKQDPLHRSCCACQKSFHIIDLINAPCNHNYCGECIRTLFQNSLVDESLFPPRCCKHPISPERSILILGQELYDSFKAKEVEFVTKDRTYCHDTSCANFIPPSAIEGKAGKCPQCNNKTCKECKAKHHTGECSDDPGTQQVLDLAAQNGWQRCGECQRVIELNTGCYHMTCPCKAQFCYLCGVKWKQCKCPQWSEERLTDRAEELVNLDVQGKPRSNKRGATSSPLTIAPIRLGVLAQVAVAQSVMTICPGTSTSAPTAALRLAGAAGTTDFETPGRVCLRYKKADEYAPHLAAPHLGTVQYISTPQTPIVAALYRMSATITLTSRRPREPFGETNSKCITTAGVEDIRPDRISGLCYDDILFARHPREKRKSNVSTPDWFTGDQSANIKIEDPLSTSPERYVAQVIVCSGTYAPTAAWRKMQDESPKKRMIVEEQERFVEK